MSTPLDTTFKSIETVLRTINDTILTSQTITTYNLATTPSSTDFLDYIKVLIWPIVVILFILIFLKQIKLLLNRIINDGEAIESSFLGLKVKLRRRLSEIDLEKTDPQKIKEELKSILHQSIIDEFKLLSSYFFTKSFQIRKKTAMQISKLAKEISIDDLLSFATSALPGERVAAFIGIKTHLELFQALENDERIIEILRIGLDDGLSRVRYRVILGISVSNHLISIFRENLESLLLEETNTPVKEGINNLLRNRNI